MEKKFILIFVILVIPIMISVGNAQTLQVDVDLDGMEDIEESKYRASGITVVRNAEGQLISVIKVDAQRYLDHPIVDEYLKTENPYVQLVNKGKLGTDTISHYRVIAEYFNPMCSEIYFETPGFNDKCDWHQSVFSTIFGITYEDYEYTVFKGLNHNFIVKSGYDLVTYWDIFTRE